MDELTRMSRKLSELGARRASAVDQLAQLTLDMRQLVWILHDTHGLSARAIARLAGISDTAVNNWIKE